MTPLSAPTVTRRMWAAAAGVVLMAGLLPASADAAPAPAPAPGGEIGSTAGTSARHGEEIGNYDSRDAGTITAGVAARRAAVAARPAAAVRKLRDGLGVQGIVEIDGFTGTPRRVARLDGYLTKTSSKKPSAIALAYVKAHADVFGLNAATLKRLTLRKDYVDVAGTHHLSFVQHVGGVPVFGNGLKAHVAKNGRLVQVDGSPVSALPASPGTATLTPAKARAEAVEDVFGDSRATVRKAGGGNTRTTTFTDGGKAQLVMFQTVRGLRLAWQTITMDEGFLHVVDAADGTVLYRQSLVAHDTAQVWDNYPGAPAGGKARTVDLKKWLPTDSPRLAGNVAHVWTDVNDDNRANPAEEVKPKSKRSFDFPFTDFTKQVGPPCAATRKCSWDPSVAYSWQKNRAQNAAQMYYFLGTWHDHLLAKPIGFTRAAGNFEAVDDDAVQGHAMDGADTANGLPDSGHVDNANMNTPPDGIAPVMQMYLFHDPSDDTDPFIAGNSGDSADILYHEYTHGLSNRLVVDATGNGALNNPQSGAMGEAWSDWYAMDYLVAKGLEKDTKAAGDLLVGRYVSAGANLIRTNPVDCPVTSTSAKCTGTPGAGAGGYTYGDFGTVAGRPEVHADGEIWAQTLWDLRTAIGSPLAQSLVTRAMELSPAEPSFLDMRNSILQADLVVNKGKQQAKIWQVFAKRGMGFFAGATGSDDVKPVEDFSTPPAAGTPRGSLTGTVSNAETGAPAAGVVVGFGGHASGFGGDYVATTGADGTYTITGILPGTYPKVFARGGGYDPQVRTLSIAARVNTANWSLRRDWAATSGGSEVVDNSGTVYPGCGPVNLFDQSQGAGWATDVVGAGDGVIRPEFTTVKLPNAVDVSTIEINPAAACGLAGSASTGDYKLETSTDGTTWVVASTGHFGVADRTMHPVPLAPGSSAGVQFVRYTMMSTQVADLGGTCPGNFSGCDYVSSTELAVYGVQR
jgi:extracellular elastinolytic metalloproteinase